MPKESQFPSTVWSFFFLAETIVDFIDVNHFVQWGREKRGIPLTKH